MKTIKKISPAIASTKTTSIIENPFSLVNFFIINSTFQLTYSAYDFMLHKIFLLVYTPVVFTSPYIGISMAPTMPPATTAKSTIRIGSIAVEMVRICSSSSSS